MPGTIPDRIWLYRIIHWQNVEHILEFGLVNHKHPNANPNYVSIGHAQLIGDRDEYMIKVKGSLDYNDFHHLGEFVPFYFGAHSVMLFMIKHGYQGVKQYPQEEIVYFITSLEKIQESNREFLFSNIHAKRKNAEFYKSLDDLDKVDWNVVKDQDWKNRENDLDRRDRKQAEFLVKDTVPIEALEYIVVQTEWMKNLLQPLVEKYNRNHLLPIQVKPNLYY